MNQSNVTPEQVINNLREASEKHREASEKRLTFEESTPEQRARMPLANISLCLEMLVSVSKWVRKTALQSQIPEFATEVLPEISRIAELVSTIKPVDGVVPTESIELLNHLIYESLGLIGATLSTLAEADETSTALISLQQLGLQAGNAEIARLGAEIATLKAAASSKPLH